MQARHTAYLLTLLTILFWAGAASAFKLALQALTPAQLLAFASTISLLVILLILLLQHKLALLRTLSLKQWGYLLLLGSINPFLYYVILFAAYDRLPGQVAMSLNYLWPLMLALLAVPILKHPLSLRSLLAILISFSGAVLIASQGSVKSFQVLDMPGILLALSSTVVWALYWLLSARIAIDTAVKLLVGFISGSVLSLLFVIALDKGLSIERPVPWLAVLYVGLFEMGITFFIWLKALQLADSAARIGNLIYLTPFLSLLLLSLIIDEKIYHSTLIGLLIIIAGILLQSKKEP